MNWQNVRWPVVVGAMAVTLAALFGAGSLMKSQLWDEPLKTLYSSTPTVESYAVEKSGEQYLIVLKLKETPDLALTYQTLDEGTARILKATPYTLKVEDRRTPALTEAYQKANLYVQEALTTGGYAAMADRVQAEAAKVSATARVGVDSDRVYVQFRGADGAYLYSIVTRPAVKTVRAEGGFGL